MLRLFPSDQFTRMGNLGGKRTKKARVFVPFGEDGNRVVGVSFGLAHPLYVNIPCLVAEVWGMCIEYKGYVSMESLLTPNLQLPTLRRLVGDLPEGVYSTRVKHAVVTSKLVEYTSSPPWPDRIGEEDPRHRLAVELVALFTGAKHGTSAKYSKKIEETTGLSRWEGRALWEWIVNPRDMNKGPTEDRRLEIAVMRDRALRRRNGRGLE